MKAILTTIFSALLLTACSRSSTGSGGGGAVGGPNAAAAGRGCQLIYDTGSEECVETTDQTLTAAAIAQQCQAANGAVTTCATAGVIISCEMTATKLVRHAYKIDDTQKTQYA